MTIAQPSHSCAVLFKPESQWKNISIPVVAIKMNEPAMRGVTHCRLSAIFASFQWLNNGEIISEVFFCFVSRM
jgi:hypothetical protein